MRLKEVPFIVKVDRRGRYQCILKLNNYFPVSQIRLYTLHIVYYTILEPETLGNLNINFN